MEYSELEQTVISSIKRDISNSGNMSISDIHNKQLVRNAMLNKRNSILELNQKWIKDEIDLGRKNLANGKDVLNSDIYPVIEECKSQKDFNLFRLYRYYWSSPYSDYVGRRIKLIIRDYSLPTRPVIGIAALGSSIIHISERDNWIGWSIDTRTENLVYTMDAYVIGALPPYNYLLGGKLISYILASNEVRDLFHHKYKDQITNVNKRVANDLACIFTTSLYGHSSQYNRIRFNEADLYIPIGNTSGFGTFHVSEQTFDLMLSLLQLKGIHIKNRFENGPCWRMRVIKKAAEELKYNPKSILNHSYKKTIYVVPLANNYIEFLKGEDSTLNYHDYPMSKLVEYWKERWLKKRIEYINSSGMVSEIEAFDNWKFDIK